MSRAIRRLLSEGQITRGEFEQATMLQAREGGTVGYYLIRLGAISDGDLTEFFTRNFPGEHWSRKRLRSLDPEVVNTLEYNIAKDLRILPITVDGMTLTLGLTDPSRPHVLEEAAFHTGCEIVPAIISEEDMSWALNHYYVNRHAPARPTYPATEAIPSPVVQLTGDAPPEDASPEAAEPDREATPEVPAAAPDEHTPEEVAQEEVAEEQAEPDKPAQEEDESEEDAPEETAPEEAPADAEKSGDTGQVLLVSSDGWDLEIPGAQINADNIFDKPLPERENAGPETDLSELPSETEIERQHRHLVDVPRSSPTRRPRPLVPGSLPDDDGEEVVDAPKPERSEGEIIASIFKAETRNEIIDLSLEYLLHFAARSAFFIIKKNEIKGFEIAGDLTSRSAIRAFWVPLNTESTLQDAAVGGHIHLGPLGRKPADAILAAALGGRPKRILVIPVKLAGRPVALLYADRLAVKMPPWNRLERLSEVVAENLKRQIVSRSQS